MQEEPELRRRDLGDVRGHRLLLSSRCEKSCVLTASSSSFQRSVKERPSTEERRGGCRYSCSMLGFGFSEKTTKMEM